MAEQAGSIDALTAALNNLGGLCERLGRPHEAAEHFHRAIALNRQVGDRSGEAIQLGNLGAVFRMLGQLERAVEHHTRALTIMRELGNRTVAAAELRELATACHALGRFELRLAAADLADAGALGEQALAIDRETGQRPAEAATHLTLGRIRRAGGDIPAAHRHWQRAYELFSILGTPEAAEAKALLDS